MLMEAEELLGSSVSMLKPGFVPWNERISTNDMKTRPAIYRARICRPQFPILSGELSALSHQDRQRYSISWTPPCTKRRKDAMIPPLCCLCLSRTRGPAGHVLGESVDAETCDG